MQAAAYYDPLESVADQIAAINRSVEQGIANFPSPQEAGGAVRRFLPAAGVLLQRNHPQVS